MPDWPIVDSHVHLIDTERFGYSWLANRPEIARSFGPADLAELQGNVEIDKIVFVEAWADAGQGDNEAAFAQKAADDGAPIAGIVANLDIRVDDVAARLDALTHLPALRGVRYLIEGAVDPTFCLEPAFLEGLRQVGQAGLTFDICVKHWALPIAAEMVRRVPDTLFVLDHIGKPGIRHGLREPWWSAIAEIAHFSNVVCKMSGVLTEGHPDHTSYEAAKPYIDRTIEVFGFDRLMYGSDWPVSEVTHRYSDWVRMLEDQLSACSQDERRAFWRDTAIRTYRLESGQ